MEIENKLVAKTRHDPIGGLAKLAAFAAEALRQMELTLKALPEGADPFLWPIFPEERELVAELQQRYPADADILVSVLDLFHQLSDRVTVDELAVGAIKGLKWKALVAGALEGSHER